MGRWLLRGARKLRQSLVPRKAAVPSRRQGRCQLCYKSRGAEGRRQVHAPQGAFSHGRSFGQELGRAHRPVLSKTEFRPPRQFSPIATTNIHANRKDG